MAVTTNYATVVTREGYIRRACMMAGLLGDKTAVDADMRLNCENIVADLLEAWHNEGINLSVNRITQYPMPTASAVLGDDGTTTFTCILGYVPTDTTTKPTTGSNWTTYWKAHGTAGGTFTVGATYTAPNYLTLPAGLMMVKEAFLRDVNGFDMPLDIISETEYNALNNKFIDGRPSKLWVGERPWNQRKAVFYPCFPDLTTHVIHINGVYLMGDMTDPSSELDAPSSARLAFVYDLASHVSALYQRPGLARQFAEMAVAYKRNFYRTNKGSKTTVSQIAPRFLSERRWRR